MTKHTTPPKPFTTAYLPSGTLGELGQVRRAHGELTLGVVGTPLNQMASEKIRLLDKEMHDGTGRHLDIKRVRQIAGKASNMQTVGYYESKPETR